MTKEPKWQKCGHVYVSGKNLPRGYQYAQMPTVGHVDGEAVKVFFSTRNSRNQSLPAFAEGVIAESIEWSLPFSGPILDLGKPGAFDDSGVMPSWVVEHEGREILYYVGWNLSSPARYRLAIGAMVAIVEFGCHLEFCGAEERSSQSKPFI